MIGKNVATAIAEATAIEKDVVVEVESAEQDLLRVQTIHIMLASDRAKTVTHTGANTPMSGRSHEQCHTPSFRHSPIYVALHL